MQLVSLLELAATIYARARWVATHQVLWFFPELVVQQFIIIIIMAHNNNCIIILLNMFWRKPQNVLTPAVCAAAYMHMYIASSGNVRVTNCVVNGIVSHNILESSGSAFSRRGIVHFYFTFPKIL